MEDYKTFEAWYENEIRSGRNPNDYGKCPLNISEPVYPVFDFSCFCECSVWEKYKTGCYFYHEEKDMGGTIPCCSYFGELGNCPCENCEKYIEQSKVFKLVKDIVDKEKNRNEVN